jgi:hypothetical protein
MLAEVYNAQGPVDRAVRPLKIMFGITSGAFLALATTVGAVVCKQLLFGE